MCAHFRSGLLNIYTQRDLLCQKREKEGRELNAHLQKMSEPEIKFANWCRHLFRMFVADSQQIEEFRTKGGTQSKLASPSPHEANFRRGYERDEMGYISEAECDESTENENPSPELVQLIRDVQPSALASGETLVPSTLPRQIRDNLYSVKREEFTDAFNVDTALKKVEEGSISRRELVCMYLKSFRNILVFDLSELRDHRQFYERIKSYCEHVFQDVMESLYPEQQDPRSVVRAVTDNYS